MKNQLQLLFTLVMSLFIGVSANAQCSYTVQLDDSYGDGWNGNELEVTYGTTVDTITLASGSTMNYTLSVSTGDTINLNYLGGGSFNSEVSFDLLDAGSISLYASGLNPATGFHFGVSANCPSCLAPTAQTANVTTTTADLGWTESGSATLWEVDYDTAGFTQGVGSMDTTSANPFSVTGLTANTSYEFYVRSICGAGDSSNWSGPYTFGTACNTFAVPFQEGFNSTSTTLGCWIIVDNNNDGDTWSINTSSSYVSEGNQSAQVYTDYNSGSNDDYLISPQITLTGNERLRYWYRARSSFEPNDYQVLVSTTTNAPASFTDTIMVDTANSTTYAEKTIDLSSYSGNVYIAFYIPAGGLDGYYLYVDDFNVEAIPSCLAPTAQTANVTATTADLGWTENGTATTWDIEWDTAGFTASGTPTITGATTNPHSLTGLTANTSYEFYVRADCGGNSSTWVGPFSFTTPCAAMTAPFTESFDNVAIPGCWSQSATTGGPWVFGNPGISWNTSGCSAPTEHTGNSGNMVSMDFSSTDVGVILELPDVDVSTLTTANLTFWYFMCTSGYTPTNKLFVEAWNGSSWAMVDSNVTGTSGWEKQSFDVSSFTYNTNLVRLRLRAESGGSSSDYYGDAGVDDVSIDELPTCPEPSALAAMNIATDSADLAWIESGSATTWQVEWDTAGFTAGNGTVISTTNNPYTLIGLSSATDYSYYVRAICGAGDTSVWVGPYSFQTTPDYCAGDHFYDDGGAANDYSTNQQDTTVICPTSVGDVVKVTFNTFATESGWDDLSIYDGSTTAVSFGTFDGSTVPGPFISTDALGCLTFVFSSDGSVVDEGWDATIQCLTPMNNAITATNVSCSGASDGTATIAVTGGTAPFGYVWTNGDTTMVSDSLSGGMNYVTVTDAAGLVSVDSITISEPAMLVATVVADSNASCFGMSDGGASVSAVGGTTPYTFVWDNTATTASITGLMAGTYYVTVTDSNSCATNDSVMITEPVMVTVDLGNDTSVCNGASLTLDAGAGYATYLWNDASTMQTLVAATATTGSVDYSIEVADANGCTANDTVNVTVFAAVTTSITGGTDLCAYETATLDAGAGFATYVWNTTETMQTINVDAATLGTGVQTFMVTVTDANGCSGDATTSFDVFAPVMVDLGPDTSIIWFGADTSYVVDAGAGFTSYLWHDATTAQSNTITLANMGNVSVVVEDGNGCLGADTVVVDFILGVPTLEVSSIKMYPNPAVDQLNIEISNFNNVKEFNVTILNVIGEVVYSEQLNASGNSYKGLVDVSSLATGTYFVQFEANGQREVRQFIIK